MRAYDAVAAVRSSCSMKSGLIVRQCCTVSPVRAFPFPLTGLDTILAAGSFSLQVAVVEGQLALSTVGLQLGKGESYVNSESLVPGSVPMQR